MHDVLVVGEALVDIVLRADGERAEHPGGSPANVALGLARLGRSAGLLTRIGRDPRGEAVRAHLEGSGVQLVPGSVTADRTSTATARLDAHGSATYEFDLDWQVPAEIVLGDARALHTGSIAAFLPPGGGQVLELVGRSRSSAMISYDPNARPRLMGDATAARQRVERFVRLADLVKVSDEDLAWLAPEQDPLRVAAAWLELGPAVVVVTRGAEGAVALAGCGQIEVPTPAVAVVDTVGAGDAFMAGLLDYLAVADLLGPDRIDQLRAIGPDGLRAMLEHAALIAAITCSRPGADPPTRDQLTDQLSRGRSR